LRIGVIGGSGYVGGELLRLLLSHPQAELTTVVSRKYAGDFIFGVHPNLRGTTNLKFVPLELPQIKENCDLVFVAMPHGASVSVVPKLLEAGLRVIDMSADFRLKNSADYVKWYGWEHAGCMATASILGLAPLVAADVIEKDRVVIDAKIGSSGAGSKPSPATHHAEKFGGVRPYKPVGHRHTAEIEQELNFITNRPITASLSTHTVNMVRGILATIHVFLTKPLTVREVWKILRSYYQNEPFIRFVRYQKGLYRFPDPKVVLGTNFCDIGFELDSHNNRLVILSAIDNLMKGASGQGVQCFNVALGIDEKTGLENIGFHPV